MVYARNFGNVDVCVITMAGFADGTGASAQFNLPYGVAVDSTGTVYVRDYVNYRIRKIQ